jgi:signal transduction histidine kinase
MERLEGELRDADKQRAISTLAAGMAHEIKNPLTSLKTFADYLDEKGADPDFQQKFRRVINQEVDRIDQIVRRLLAFAKPSRPNFEPVDISRLLDETLDLISAEALRRRIEIERVYNEPITIQADSEQLRQVFLNIFLNSFEAVNGSGGKLFVTTARKDENVIVSIHDTGSGIPRENLERIFDPFFTTKSAGTGLGLSIALGIIKDHHGELTFESGDSGGTTCTVVIPHYNAT